MIDVGTSTWRQISGSVCRNSIRTVAISLMLSDAVFVLAGLIPSSLCSAARPIPEYELVRLVDYCVADPKRSAVDGPKAVWLW